MKCPTCGAKLELYAPGRVDWEVVETSSELPSELRSEILRLFSAGREAVFKCCGGYDVSGATERRTFAESHVEHFWTPSDFPEDERRELERQNLASIELSKRDREAVRERHAL